MENLNEKIRSGLNGKLDSLLYGQLNLKINWELRKRIRNQLDWYLYWRINERLKTQMKDGKSQ